ncbi:MAG: hypothetical protein EAY76_02690 [Alphaproteobacteria bacterium]|nr:MAG: hypothetical protein EAY76_02690 [Alphaproteobacteria bacterium]TAF41473.1 MAG: hypothetical protein EAZ66_01315 [Alphaproteobacteria bacterium]TAF75723.1 MAG: hypothetical protein EAZ52_06040 [Alphaproteobacteria bacterium]
MIDTLMIALDLTERLLGVEPNSEGTHKQMRVPNEMIPQRDNFVKTCLRMFRYDTPSDTAMLLRGYDTETSFGYIMLWCIMSDFEGTYLKPHIVHSVTRCANCKEQAEIVQAYIDARLTNIRPADWFDATVLKIVAQYKAPRLLEYIEPNLRNGTIDPAIYESVESILTITSKHTH